MCYASYPAQFTGCVIRTVRAQMIPQSILKGSYSKEIEV